MSTMNQQAGVACTTGAANMMAGFNKFRQEGMFFDFKIRINENEFPVHKLLLIALSDYFKGMLSHNTIENETQVAIIEEIEPKTMEVVLDFCYTGTIELTSHNVSDILQAASFLQMASLQETCCIFIENGIDDNNCLQVLSLANRINLERLMVVGLAYCCKNFDVIVEKAEFLLIDKTVIGRILGEDGLAVDDELQVFQALAKWVEHDEPARKQYLDDLLPLVRFAQMDAAALIELGSQEIFRNSLARLRLLDIAKNYHLLKSTTSGSNTLGNEINTKPRQISFAASNGRYFHVLGGEEHSSVSDCDGQYYTCSGYNTKLYNYDRVMKSWTVEQAVSPDRVSFGCSILDGVIYIIGGQRLEYVENDICDGYNNIDERSCLRLNPKSQTEWCRDIPSMVTAKSRLRAVTLNNCIYAIGGSTGSTKSTSTVEYYNPSTNIWSTHEPLSVARHSFGATIHNGTIYVAGGRSATALDSRLIKTVERLNEQGSWEFVPSLQFAREGLSLCSCQGVLYAVGGSEHNVAEYYDEQENTWRLTSRMIHAHKDTETIVLNGIIYAVSHFSFSTVPDGYSHRVESHPIRTMESYNPATRTWTRESAMPDNVSGFSLI